MRRSRIELGSRKRICNTHTFGVCYFANVQFSRATASKILEEYLVGIGGKDKIMADYKAKKSETGGKGKKRVRASTDAEPNGSAPKRGRGRKNGVHPGSTTPPASAGEFKPPTGNWEEQIVAIDACEGGEGNVVVYLTWKGGHKTQHPLSQVYKRCPQRVRLGSR
jgi:chromobox protein 1